MRLAADGQDVVVAYTGNEIEAKSTVAAIEEAGGRVVAAQVEVADEIRSGPCSTRRSSRSAAWTWS